MVEGIALVATPALIRDFSPQVGRATAMGFWTAGPVLGSLIVTVVGSNTIPAVEPRPAVLDPRVPHLRDRRADRVRDRPIGLRELSPQLRDQLMVTMRDRILIEARARGLDVGRCCTGRSASCSSPTWSSRRSPSSVMLLIYYTAVGFGLIYLTSVFGFSVKDANGWATGTGGSTSSR